MIRVLAVLCMFSFAVAEALGFAWASRPTPARRLAAIVGITVAMLLFGAVFMLD